MTLFDDHGSDHSEATERVANEQAMAVEDVPAREEDAELAASSSAKRSGHVRTRVELNRASTGLGVEPEKTAGTQSLHQGRATSRWWLVAAGSALLLTLLTIAAAYLITRKPSTVDQLVILTVPSGAEIRLDSKNYGNSPVKLEQVRVGTYTLTINKEGYAPIVQQIEVTDSLPLEFKLKPVPPSDAVGLSDEEAVSKSQRSAEETFLKGHYGLPFEGSALAYSDFILSIDPSNQFAIEMKERVRKALHQSAQAASSSGDLGRAQEIYELLRGYYAGDEEARIAAARLDAQLSSRRGEVQPLLRKAEEAMRSGNLIEPQRASAYYYSKQVLAIDRQNAQAQAIQTQIKEKIVSASQQAYARGDIEVAIKQLEELTKNFAQDKQLSEQLREMRTHRKAEVDPKATDPSARRHQGLEKYGRDEFSDAIPHLLYAITNGKATPDVLFALARSYQKTNQLEQAAHYYRLVPESAGDQYRSSIAALGDIALQRGDVATALERFKEARRLGGSGLYLIPNLDDKIERIEKRQREKAEQPTQIMIEVKHQHGGLGGSCKGTLTVGPTGVRYDGSEHSFSLNLLNVGVQVSKGEMVINKSHKFKAVVSSDAERFRETLAKFQSPQHRQ